VQNILKQNEQHKTTTASIYLLKKPKKKPPKNKQKNRTKTWTVRNYKTAIYPIVH
jgi:hypothetical protein